MSIERDRWIAAGKILGATLREEGVSLELIDALDDHMLEGLFMAFTGGYNAKTSGVDPDSAGQTYMGLIRPMAPVEKTYAEPEPPDDSNVAGYFDQTTYIHATARDKFGKIK